MDTGHQLDITIERDGHRSNVECDGEPFHRGRERDQSRDAALERDGWTVIRFSAREIMRDSDLCVRRVQAEAKVGR